MIGDRQLRKEDARFLTGRGRYLADHDVPGLLHVAIVRSPFAHARLDGIDVSEAKAAPGVVAVVTQADLEAAGAQPMTHRLTMPGIQPLTWGVLATDAVRFVGEPIVAVVAASRAEAEDACELVEVDYKPLPAVVDPLAALEPGAPLLYPAWGSNVFFTAATPVEPADAAIAAAPHQLTERVSHHRIQGLPLETSGAQASIDPQSGGLVVLSSNQQPHQLRTVIAETVGLPESAVRVIAPDMGGGFGNKQHFTREECLVALLARITERPVRWSQDRGEGLTSAVHSRAQEHVVTCGYDDTGKVLGYKVEVVADLGNPVLYFSGIGPALVTIGCLAGGYDFGPVAFDLRCVATTTCPVGAYRGFGQPEAHVTSERVLDTIAERLGLDPVDVRRRNFLPDSPRPYIAESGARIDIGSLGPHLDHLLDEVDYAGWRKRQADARTEGRYVGIGLSTLVQGTAPTQYGVAGRFGSWESASVSVLPDGTVTVFVGTKSQGQAHETVFAQVVADAMGVPVDRVTVKDGDTAALPYGMGTWGSRSAVMGGGAVLTASTRLREKMDLIAVHMGGDPTFEQIAEEVWWHAHRLPHHLEPGLTSTAVYTPGNTAPVPDANGKMNFEETYGAHMTCVVVEVDPDTGDVELLDAVLISDCGRVINPMVVEGQHQGGFVQGLGNVLHEEIRYDEDGNPLTATLVDYTPPLATDVIDVRILHRETPSENAGGFRGMGEAGIIAAPAAIAGAVADALRPLGVEVWSTRLHAHHIRAMVRTSRGS
ncbi:MAG: molybdenum hydroxylase family protein large subunit [Actinomycetia bacterium]|nr:molybdenum hydroxylase family protein large subunit [Actinomycetes bacterium]